VALPAEEPKEHRESKTKFKHVVILPQTEGEYALNQDKMPHKLVQVVNKVVIVILVATKHPVAIIFTEAIPLKEEEEVSQVLGVVHADTA
jgi:hypothetical protein